MIAVFLAQLAASFEGGFVEIGAELLAFTPDYGSHEQIAQGADDQAFGLGELQAAESEVVEGHAHHAAKLDIRWKNCLCMCQQMFLRDSAGWRRERVDVTNGVLPALDATCPTKHRLQ